MRTQAMSCTERAKSVHHNRSIRSEMRQILSLAFSLRELRAVECVVLVDVLC